MLRLGGKPGVPTLKPDKLFFFPVLQLVLAHVTSPEFSRVAGSNTATSGVGPEGVGIKLSRNVK